MARIFYDHIVKRFPVLAQNAALFASAPLRMAPKVRMTLSPTDVAHGRIAWLGSYEEALTRKLWALASNPGGTLLDVGANYGYFSLLWCAANKSNSAMAIEASPRNVAALRSNISTNGFGDRIKLFTWAASNANGEVAFSQGPTEQTGWGGIARVQDSETVTVPCFRLDDKFPNERFAVMKIDCEGADPLVIMGASKLLDTHAIRHVFYEENIPRMSDLGINPGSAKNVLEKSGYRVEEISPGEFHGWCK